MNSNKSFLVDSDGINDIVDKIDDTEEAKGKSQERRNP